MAVQHRIPQRERFEQQPPARSPAAAGLRRVLVTAALLVLVPYPAPDDRDCFAVYEGGG